MSDTDELPPVIRPPDLQQYLGDRYRGEDVTYLVTLVNGAVNDTWTNPVTPAPTLIKALALVVADRAYENPRGLSSWTRSGDEISRTERLSEKYAQAGVFLTDLERRQLQGGKKARRRYGSLRTRPGY